MTPESGAQSPPPPHFPEAPGETPGSRSPLTVEPGLGGDAAADAEAVLPVADMEGGHGWVVGDLWAGRQV